MGGKKFTELSSGGGVGRVKGAWVPQLGGAELNCPGVILKPRGRKSRKTDTGHNEFRMGCGKLQRLGQRKWPMKRGNQPEMLFNRPSG